MIIECIKSESIDHNSYLLGSGTDAVIIDPLRKKFEYAVLRWQPSKIKRIRKSKKGEKDHGKERRHPAIFTGNAGQDQANGK
jgi:hypothetical protein